MNTTFEQRDINATDGLTIMSGFVVTLNVAYLGSIPPRLDKIKLNRLV